jgi:serine protease AprX
MTRMIVALLAVAVLAGAAFVAAASAVDTRAAAPQGVLHGGSQKLWVLFSDKGVTRAEEQAAIDAFGNALPERSIARRAKVGFGVNMNDLPVAVDYVNAVSALGVEVVTRSRWLNAVSVYADAGQAAAIAALPFVSDVRPVAHGTQPIPEIVPARPPIPSGPRGGRLDYGDSQGQLEQIQVDLLHDEGLDGSGVMIAMLDTGFDTDHQAYRHLNIVAERDFINGDTETANQPGDPDGQDGHGTATLSCVGAKYPGVIYGGSYGADFVLCKTEIVDDEIEIEEDYWQEAIEWADSLGADVVSSSLGYFYWYTYEDMDGNTAVVTKAADMAAARGIVVVNSMGNEGGTDWMYMIAPADGDSVLSVGAVDADGDRTWFSSVGPTYDGRTKPDVMALGLDTYVATTEDTASYGFASGTSFSCPLTAGAVGLILQARPEWTPSEVIDAVHETATQSDSPDTLMGWGILQAWDARNTGGEGVVGDEVSSPRLILARPNPSSRGASLEFTLVTGGRTTVTLYDVSGRVVRTLLDRPLPAGPHSLEWDGRDDAESVVASGVYFARLRAPDGVRATAKVTVVR